MNQTAFEMISDKARTFIGDFFDNSELSELFITLFYSIKREETATIIRGDSSVIGVSMPGERYIFYAAVKEGHYTIKFQGHNTEKYVFENASTYLQLALETVTNRRDSLQNYQIKGRQVNGDADQSVKKNVKGSSTDAGGICPPLYIKFNVAPENYVKYKVTQDLFSVRAYNCLTRNGIKNVGMILMNSEQDLLQMANLGSKTYYEIIRVLDNIIKGYYTPPENAIGMEDDEQGDENTDECSATFIKETVHESFDDANTNVESENNETWGHISATDGSWSYEGFTVNGKPFGLGTVYFADGKKYMEGIFGFKGLLLGWEYYPNGRVRFEGKYNLNYGYGPNYPYNGRYFNKDGELLYNGIIPYRKTGLGWPEADDPKLGNALQEGRPLCEWINASDIK